MLNFFFYSVTKYQFILLTSPDQETQTLDLTGVWDERASHPFPSIFFHSGFMFLIK